MGAITIDQIIQIGRDAGGFGILVVVLGLIATGRLVPRPYFDAIKDDRDEWKGIALEFMQAGEKATNVAEHIVKERRPRRVRSDVKQDV